MHNFDVAHLKILKVQIAHRCAVFSLILVEFHLLVFDAVLRANRMLVVFGPGERGSILVTAKAASTTPINGCPVAGVSTAPSWKSLPCTSGSEWLLIPSDGVEMAGFVWAADIFTPGVWTLFVVVDPILAWPALEI